MVGLMNKRHSKNNRKKQIYSFIQLEIFKVVLNDRPVVILIRSMGCTADGVSHSRRTAAKHAYFLHLKTHIAPIGAFPFNS
jgi:hypothetical protein